MQSGPFIGDIAFGVAFAFLCGVFASDIGWNAGIVLAAATLGATAFPGIRKDWRRGWWAWPAAALVLGILYVHIFLGWRSANQKLPLGSPVTFSAVISDEPHRSEKHLVVTVLAVAPFEGSARILAPPSRDLNYGDLVRVDGIIDASGGPAEDPVVFKPTAITVLARHRGFFCVNG